MVMVEALKFIWQLPQIVAAFIYFIYLDCKDGIVSTCTYKDVAIFIKRRYGGCVTLGDHIFLSPRASESTIRHEYGHTRQSLILGPLYLIIIGIPSIIWAATHHVITTGKDYDWFYTEAWANKLGGVE